MDAMIVSSIIRSGKYKYFTNTPTGVYFSNISLDGPVQEHYLCGGSESACQMANFWGAIVSGGYKQVSGCGDFGCFIRMR